VSQLTLRTWKTCAASIGGAAKSVCGQAEAKGEVPTLRKEREGWGTRKDEKQKADPLPAAGRLVAWLLGMTWDEGAQDR